MSKQSDNEAFVRWIQGVVGVTADGHAGPATKRAVERELTGEAAPALFDYGKFFARVRADFGKLSQPQVDGFSIVTAALKGWDVTWVAYALATAYHETAHTMQPVKEYGGDAYFRKMYDINGDRPQKARELGNVNPGDGVRYAGRGYVQLTGRDNYTKFGIENAPDDAMKPEIAARIMRNGMESGVFTGKALRDYLPGDYVNARRIINGRDKAELIAGYARNFEAALRAGGWR